LRRGASVRLQSTIKKPLAGIGIVSGTCYNFKKRKDLIQLTSPSDLQYIIPAAWRGQRLETFLRRQLGLSRGRIRALKKNDALAIDGRPTLVSHILAGGEQLKLRVAIPHAQPQIIPEALPLSLLYEDQDLAVIDKSAGMVTHPVKKHQSGTLANALLYHWQARSEPASFHPVHRLDRLTSGVIVIAKNSWAHQQLDRQIGLGKFNRLYLAICWGTPQSTGAKIIAPIQSFPDTPRRAIRPDGQPAATRYRVLAHSQPAALLAIKLFTGRTHQIRVHLAFLGHALWGDPLYGQPDPAFAHPALHAVRIAFTHPRSGLPLQFTAPIPADFKDLAKRLGLPEIARELRET
jgi:23S rRNA pseudouridine1911/1915/1917 synthase